jgi:hypothetical protein
LRRKLEEGLRLGVVGYAYLVTLTAPGSIGHQRFVPGVRGKHGVCGCEARIPDLAEWNAQAAACWNRLATRLRATFEGIGYGRVSEVQDGKRRADGVGRGALHHHVLLTSLVRIDVAWLHAQAISAGYGCVLDVAVITDPAAAAAYVAKYTTKGGRDRRLCKWSREVVDTTTGELTREGGWPTYRAWSASRDFGPSIAFLRGLAREQAQARDLVLRALAEVEIPTDNPLSEPDNRTAPP